MRAKEQDTNRADRGVKSSPPIQEAIWSATQMTIIGFLVNTSCYPTATYLCTHHILQIDTSDIFFPPVMSYYFTHIVLSTPEVSESKSTKSQRTTGKS